jgi:predicted thioesterase
MLLALRIPLIPTGAELTAVLVVVCFSAGLNVYATVAMLGFLSRAGALMLPGSLHGIESW